MFCGILKHVYGLGSPTPFMEKPCDTQTAAMCGSHRKAENSIVFISKLNSSLGFKVFVSRMSEAQEGCEEE